MKISFLKLKFKASASSALVLSALLTQFGFADGTDGAEVHYTFDAPCPIKQVPCDKDYDVMTGKSGICAKLDKEATMDMIDLSCVGEEKCGTKSETYFKGIKQLGDEKVKLEAMLNKNKGLITEYQKLINKKDLYRTEVPAAKDASAAKNATTGEKAPDPEKKCFTIEQNKDGVFAGSYKLTQDSEEACKKAFEDKLKDVKSAKETLNGDNAKLATKISKVNDALDKARADVNQTVDSLTLDGMLFAKGLKYVMPDQKSGKCLEGTQKLSLILGDSRETMDICVGENIPEGKGTFVKKLIDEHGSVVKNTNWNYLTLGLATKCWNSIANHPYLSTAALLTTCGAAAGGIYKWLASPKSGAADLNKQLQERDQKIVDLEKKIAELEEQLKGVKNPVNKTRVAFKGTAEGSDANKSKVASVKPVVSSDANKSKVASVKPILSSNTNKSKKPHVRFEQPAVSLAGAPVENANVEKLSEPSKSSVVVNESAGIVNDVVTSVKNADVKPSGAASIVRLLMEAAKS